MKKSDISSLTNKAVKIFLSGAFMVSTAFTLTGCDSAQKEPTDEIVEEEVVEEEVERELTPLEQEISELEDFQFTDKIYNNEDLEPFNKIQGYLYSVSKEGFNGYEHVTDIIAEIPPEEISQLEVFGKKYTIMGNVIAPVYYCYSYAGDTWKKLYPIYMNDRDLYMYQTALPENKFLSDEELDEIFGYREYEEPKSLQFKR